MSRVVFWDTSATHRLNIAMQRSLYKRLCIAIEVLTGLRIDLRVEGENSLRIAIEDVPFARAPTTPICAFKKSDRLWR